VRALDAFADFDRVREHALDTIGPNNQVTRSGWVGGFSSTDLFRSVGWW
jgi:hypothetical protein